jgi:hypothetical protein
MNFKLSRRARSAHELARGLGWFSIGLGLAEFIAQRGMGGMVGVKHPHVWRSYGLRELTAGIGLLTASDPKPWMWGRVAGDALDLATLSTGLAGRRPLSALTALIAVAGVTFLDFYCAQELEDASKPKSAVRDYSGRSGFPPGAGADARGRNTHRRPIGRARHGCPCRRDRRGDRRLPVPAVPPDDPRHQGPQDPEMPPLRQ